MKDRDLAEADQDLWVRTYGSEVDTIRNTVGPLSAPRRDDGSNGLIPDGVVEVCETVFVSTG
ncbi:hypothetical protein G6L23_026195 (plasmid) [Agrobacterium tumefaciens]|nr:hypothetical protein [Agrobacterium tumefaciens]WCK68896.1 hypothetical protein G6L23_026195 [Agrobacterium tumefaciens]